MSFSNLLSSLLLFAACAGLSSLSFALENLMGATKVAAGQSHACAIVSGGAVQCWGSNFSGQLGNGTSGSEQRAAAPVIGLGSAAVLIAAGSEHTCAVLANGEVKCWGSNRASSAGGPSSFVAPYLVPMAVTGIGGDVAAIAAGGLHTCVLTAAGGVKCWGSNGLGQLGRGTTSSAESSAADVAGLTSGVVAIAATISGTCAALAGGGVKCWGAHAAGSNNDSPTPVAVLGLDDVVQMDGGFSDFCGITASGIVKCWDMFSPIGAPPQPQEVSGFVGNVVRITLSWGHRCALTNTSRAYCWGANGWGELGDGTLAARSSPVEIAPNPTALVDIATGLDYTCGVEVTGSVRCWGHNGIGQLGNNVDYNTPSPVDVFGLDSGVAAVSSGSGISCALTQSGGVKCWGSNSGNALGDGTTTRRSVPVDVLGLQSGMAFLHSAFLTSCVLTETGGVKCWGNNAFTQLKTPAGSVSVPIDIASLGTGVTSVAVGETHVCAVVAGGGVKCMGGNFSGELGDNTQTSRSNPAYVTGLSSGVLAVAAGRNHACALMVDGRVKCWGGNSSGQLGDGTTVLRLTPVDVSSPNTVFVAVTAGNNFTCAITNTGGAKCWGENYGGSLGDGTFTGKTLPVDVVGLTSGVAQIRAGSSHACAILSSGQVKCWGANRSGQLGNGTFTSANVPSDVSGVVGAISVSAGTLHTCAVTAAGATQCWGNRNEGAVGDGVSAENPVAVKVLTSRNVVPFMHTDFNGDGRSDMLWHNSATGMVYELQMNGLTAGAGAVIDQETDLNWKIAAVADLNGDGRADVVWQHDTTGQVYGLLMNGTTASGEGTIYTEANTNWKIVGAGDFNGDSRADLLWKNNATGDVFLLMLNGLTVTSGGVIYSEPNTAWQIQKVADFNGDGRADVLWRNTATGDVYMMLMNGTTVTGGGVIYSEPNTAWQIQAAADFNGDGRADVLWRNTATGDVYMMLMNGTTITGGSVFYGEPNADWKIVASGDYNGDGRADILWRNTATGQVFMMLMNGFTISSGGFVYTEPDQNWRIVGP